MINLFEDQKAKDSFDHELAAVELFESHYPMFKFEHTDKNSNARVDGFLTQRGQTKYVIETKCRDFTLETLEGRYNNEFMIEASKIKAGGKIADAFKVPFFAFFYLHKEGILYMNRLWYNGKPAYRFEERYVACQRSCADRRKERKLFNLIPTSRSIIIKKEKNNNDRYRKTS